MEESIKQQAEERAKENYMKFPDSPDYNSIVDTKMSGFIRGYLDCYEVNKVEELKEQIVIKTMETATCRRGAKKKEQQIAKLREDVESVALKAIELATGLKYGSKESRRYLEQALNESQ